VLGNASLADTKFFDNEYMRKIDKGKIKQNIFSIEGNRNGRMKDTTKRRK